jgi:hypothetical protein
VFLLDRAEEFAEGRVESAAIGGGKGAQKGRLVFRVRGDRPVDRALAFARQPDEGASPIRWVRAPLQEAGFGQAVEALGHAAGGEHGRSHQFRRIELVRGAGSAKRGQKVEPAWLQAVGGEALGELRLGKARGSKQAAEGTEGLDVEVRALLSPLGLDAVDVIRHAFSILLGK